MLLHLPIAILASLFPITVSDTAPKFDIAKVCQFEGVASAILDRCSHDEAAALQQLQAEWSQFAGSDRTACLTEATSAGFASYVDFPICLEMARDVRNERTNPGNNPPAKTEVQSARPPEPEVSLVDKHD